MRAQRKHAVGAPPRDLDAAVVEDERLRGPRLGRLVGVGHGAPPRPRDAVCRGDRPRWSGSAARPPGRWRGRESHRVRGAGGDLLILDTLPLPPDLERLLAGTAAAGSVVAGRELVFGAGAIELAPLRFAARGDVGALRACLDGNGTWRERSLAGGDGQHWRLAVDPAGRLELAWIGTDVGTIEVRRIEHRTVAGNGDGTFKNDGLLK